ncbi:MAG: FIST C-terminal domain-containing protein [Desulfovibrio sp.]|jgi:hypothetical protein|nr:FIST C-terminal domain-containing protein [Desulfovibrio sp.]
MIRVLRAFTQEIDDPEAAVADILRQLDLPSRLLARSAGLMFCNLDFMAQGVATKLCESLPFPVIGCTSEGSAMPEIHDSFLLALLVFTSDEHAFSAGASEPLDQDAGKRLGSLYRSLAGSLPGRPSLMLAFAPALPYLSGDMLAEILDEASDQVPLFGSIALDETRRYQTAHTLHNGLIWRNRLVLLLIQGPLAPSFFLQLPRHRQMPMDQDEALITAAKDNRILSINNMPAVAYLEKIGLVREGILDTLYAVPFFLKPPGQDETLCSCAAEPDGSIACMGRVFPNSLLRFGILSNDSVLESAEEMAATIRKTAGDPALILLFSCSSRTVALQDHLAEMALLRERLAGLPFVFTHAAGEFCPRPSVTPRSVFQQYSLTGCLI